MSGTPFTVKAVFEYTSEHEDDLNFSIGQIITVNDVEDEEWYGGEYTDESGVKREGIFPRNFVERYEPPAPPRPTRPHRPKKEPEPVSHAEPSAPAPSSQAPEAKEAPAEPASEQSPVSHHAPEAQPEPEARSPKAEVPPAAPPVTSPPATTHAEPPVPAAQKPKGPPPAVAEKPSGSSFKDRIAAFNKPAAPIVPFNPNSNNSTSFVKKPFVAPPPSKNAYVPPPVEQPQKVYRREEDPDIVQRTSQEQPRMEPPARAPAEAASEESEDQPKPTSLKERIALLQKQQLEQAQRHAEAAHKKEKPKKPAKKAPEPQEAVEQPDTAAHGAELERTDTSETAREAAPLASPHEEHGHKPRRPTAAPHMDSPTQPSRELTSDTNDADYSGAGDTEEADETSTSKEDIDEPTQEAQQGAEGESDEEEEEEEEIDPEVKRRMEIRDRMAKMSGGMGMMGMFGPPGGMPTPAGGGFKKRPSTDVERKGSVDKEPPASPGRAPPVPLMALPGMQNKKPAEPSTAHAEAQEEKEEEDTTPQPQEPSAPEDVGKDTTEPSEPAADRAPPPPPHQERAAPPPPPTATRPVPPRVPSDQSAPPVPKESRPIPVLPSRTVAPPTPGEEADDELSTAPRLDDASSAQATPDLSSEGQVKTSTTAEKRASRAPPPPPPAAPPLASPTQSRPPPPPPPGPISRKSTGDSIPTPTATSENNSEGEVTEYDGDYDTDIASGAKHKDALKAHGRDSSFDEGATTDEFSLHSPRSPEMRPPIPSTSAPRAAPPPPPTQPPKASRKSTDMPRVPPPPIPPPKEPSEDVGNDDEYDPFRYTARPPIPTSGRTETSATVHAPAEERDDDDLYEASPVQSHEQQPIAPPPPPPDQPSSVPPPPPSQAPAPPAPTRGGSRQSVDMLRGGNTRRSMDVSRPADQGYIANDVDLGQHTMWWTQPQTPPPVFQGRRDILFEMEESSSSKRGGATTISKDVYVLFMDYSQTIISAEFDTKNPIDATLEQRHQPPPQRLRQDQLEDAHTQFGAKISDAVTSKQNTTVGDGTPHVLVRALLEPLSDALLPVGVRAYGALVYANLANASVQQFDEIRAGDIVTFRNARFQGHRGTMHQKYSTEAGKPDHVGVVVDWDGTKKKIRAWEQGRESKKVKVESFKLGDLKSGECRVWRVMPRSWVGWERQKA